jgi:hypothetical protein
VIGLRPPSGHHRRFLVCLHPWTLRTTNPPVPAQRPLRGCRRPPREHQNAHPSGRRASSPGCASFAPAERCFGRSAGASGPRRSPRVRRTEQSQRPADWTRPGGPGRGTGLPRLPRFQSSQHRRSRGCSCRCLTEASLKMTPLQQRDRLLASGSPAEEVGLVGLSQSTADLLPKPTSLQRMFEVARRRTAPARVAVAACRCQVPEAAALSNLVSMKVEPWAHRDLAERCVSPPFSDSLDRRTAVWPVRRRWDD